MLSAKSSFVPTSWFRPFIQEPIDEDDVNSKQKTPSRPWTVIFLLALCLLGLASSIYISAAFHLSTAYASVSLWTVTILLLAAFRPRTGSALLVSLYTGIFLAHGVSVARLSVHGWDLTMAWDGIGAMLAIICIVVVLNMPLRDPTLSRAGISQPFTTPEKGLRSPEDDLTLWQWMSVSWLSPLIAIGNKRQLNDEDVWLLGYEFQHTQLHEAFRELKGTVIRRLIKANWIDLFILTFLCLFELAGNLGSPVILQHLLQTMDYLETDKRPAILWATSLAVLRLLLVQNGVFMLWFGRRCYERSRGEMVTMLHEKVLNRKIIGLQPDEIREEGHKASDGGENGAVTVPNDHDHDSTESQGLLQGHTKSRQGWIARVMFRLRSCFPSKQRKELPDVKSTASMGKVLNLMRNDVYEVSQRFWEYSDLIQKPLGLIFSVALAWQFLGWSCLVGIAVVLLAQGINAILARILIKWEQARRQATDHKLQQVTQYIEAIRHLRWYGWHKTMLEDVMSARQKELNIRIVTLFINMCIMFVNSFGSGLLPLAAFWAYTSLAGQQLRVDIAFPALQLFSYLQSNLRAIPDLITTLINASIAVGRIEDFMSEPDIDLDNNNIAHANELALKNASFAWPGRSDLVLHDISLSFQPGLNIVIGEVASGKTALLQALLGEIDIHNGELIKPDAAIAYCAQTPWLQSMSIKENILFGAPYIETRYRKALEVCALLPDLASFEQGDLSPIGENGIGLSGGQKARVALARAVYSSASYLLLDDPISALDQQTAEWIVRKCFAGELLKGRTIILVTHRVDLCQTIAVQTIEMSEGSVARTTMQDRQTISDGHLDHALQRVESVPQAQREAQESAAIREKFEEEEHRTHGGIQIKVYWEYIKAGKLRLWFLVIMTIVLWRILSYAQTWFLKGWGEAYRTSGHYLSLFVYDHYQQTLEPYIQPVKAALASTRSPFDRLFDRLPDPNTDVKPWLVVLLILIVSQNLALFFSEATMIVVSYIAGKTMFANIMVSISNATFRFYDITPVGRLMNRITGDVGTVDGPISHLFNIVAWQMINWIAAVAVIASVTPMFLIVSISLSVSYVYIFQQFMPTSQSLRRLEMVSLSPLMSNFGALLHGLTTVRAFQAQTQFQARVIEVTDAFQKMDHFYWSTQAWLMFRFDTLSSISTYILTILAVFSGLSPGLTAYLLTASNKFVQSTHSLCKRYGQLQLSFVSVERVVELLNVSQEDPGFIDPPATWPKPSGSEIVFENVTIRYAPHLPPALSNVSFAIPAGKSTAVIGRTGSGKSTLALSLLCTMTPESGRILIDGIDISKVSKQILRERITFLAQDPVLFPGTLRTNLDPLSGHSDTECEQVLTRIGGQKYNWTLKTAVDTGGKNLSQGQRQLVGLARAILRRSSIVILDEATASIDFETSRYVQQVLREELGHGKSTIVGIAHRASAVEGCDFVIRLKDGVLDRAGSPDQVDIDINIDADTSGSSVDIDDGGNINEV